MAKIYDTPKDRLTDRIAFAGNNCIEWTGLKTKDGYGRLTVDGKEQRAHRFSYELNVGPIPDGMCVLHRCDNRACLNPNHLFLGTNADNNLDRDNKGRTAIGGKNGRDKLTPEQVLKIREDKRFCTVIAAEYKISKQLVSRIRRRELWKHLTE